MKTYTILGSAALLALSAASALAQNPPAPPQPMSFFVSSIGPGKGGDLGGLAGADAHCQKLAAAVGAGAKTWHAYLSTTAKDGQAALNARDRIGNGPWFNAKGARIAKDLGDLHGDTLPQAQLGNNLSKATALNEKGETVKGFGDTPNQHDVLTGTRTDGTAFPGGSSSENTDHTCNNWTSSDKGSAQVGHHDRNNGGNVSWNSTHASRGCSQENLISTGGAGLLYCFAQ
jgi:hypothetical protein